MALFSPAVAKHKFVSLLIWLDRRYLNPLYLHKLCNNLNEKLDLISLFLFVLELLERLQQLNNNTKQPPQSTDESVPRKRFTGVVWLLIILTYITYNIKIRESLCSMNNWSEIWIESSAQSVIAISISVCLDSRVWVEFGETYTCVLWRRTCGMLLLCVGESGWDITIMCEEVGYNCCV